jgi:hypothetical protein
VADEDLRGAAAVEIVQVLGIESHDTAHLVDRGVSTTFVDATARSDNPNVLCLGGLCHEVSLTRKVHDHLACARITAPKGYLERIGRDKLARNRVTPVVFR